MGSTERELTVGQRSRGSSPHSLVRLPCSAHPWLQLAGDTQEHAPTTNLPAPHIPDKTQDK